MDTTQLISRQQAAERLAREAGRLAQSYLAEPATLGVHYKRAQDVVTAADTAVERMIVGALATAFPDDAVLGEESGPAGNALAAAPCWVIDPIDGTANFARGLPHWCVAIALVVAGCTELGVIFDPSGDLLYSGRRGAGAFRNGMRLQVSSNTDAARAMVDVGYSSRTPAEGFGRMVTDLLGRGVNVTQCGSAALGLARVADGRLDGYAERHLYAWDALAGLLLVEEAGGCVSAFLESDALIRGNETIAATPALYPVLSAVMDAH